MVYAIIDYQVPGINTAVYDPIMANKKLCEEKEKEKS